MDYEKLRTIFDNYIRKFDVINSAEHDENYKWRLAAQFRDWMNPDNPDFLAGMKQVARISYNLFDNRATRPLSGLITCAKTDEDAVRSLFRELFANDGGNLKARQDKIDVFLGHANTLIKKAYAGRSYSKRYWNDQRAAMSYLFFRDPDSHYLYKWREASKFADCSGFEDSWKWGRSGFKMEVYYRMCDELVEAIRSYPPLLETTKRRYQEAPWNMTRLHEDTNYHILAFDLIWGTGITDNPHYNFGEKLETSTPSPTQ